MADKGGIDGRNTYNLYDNNNTSGNILYTNKIARNEYSINKQRSSEKEYAECGKPDSGVGTYIQGKQKGEGAIKFSNKSSDDNNKTYTDSELRDKANECIDKETNNQRSLYESKDDNKRASCISECGGGQERYYADCVSGLCECHSNKAKCEREICSQRDKTLNGVYIASEKSKSQTKATKFDVIDDRCASNGSMAWIDKHGVSSNLTSHSGDNHEFKSSNAIELRANIKPLAEKYMNAR